MAQALCCGYRFPSGPVSIASVGCGELAGQIVSCMTNLQTSPRPIRSPPRLRYGIASTHRMRGPDQFVLILRLTV
jgi:hypothetical protein